MPRKGWSTALVLAACSSPNPAYLTAEAQTEGEATDDPSNQVDATSEGSETGPVEGAEAGAETSDDDDSSDGSERCPADLYALNEDGVLHLVDLDTQTTVAVPLLEELASWAFATHPTTGFLYISPMDAPSVVRVVEPTSLEVEETTLEVTANEVLTRMARAGFDEDGQLWLGTHDTNRFFRLSLSLGTSVEQSVFGIGAGGDMVFIDSTVVLVPSLQGDLSQVDFMTEEVSPVPIDGLVPDTHLTGIAFDRDGQLWIARVDGQLLRVDQVRMMVAETIELAIEITDLAPIVVPPDPCR